MDGVATLSKEFIQECEYGTINRGSFIKIGEKKIAPNAIFRVVSCLYILYDLTCLI